VTLLQIFFSFLLTETVNSGIYITVMSDKASVIKDRQRSDLKLTTVFVERDAFYLLKQHLKNKNISFGSWLRKKMQEEIEKEDNASRNS